MNIKAHGLELKASLLVGIIAVFGCSKALADIYYTASGTYWLSDSAATGKIYSARFNDDRSQNCSFESAFYEKTDSVRFRWAYNTRDPLGRTVAGKYEYAEIYAIDRNENSTLIASTLSDDGFHDFSIFNFPISYRIKVQTVGGTYSNCTGSGTIDANGDNILDWVAFLKTKQSTITNLFIPSGSSPLPSYQQILSTVWYSISN